MNTPTQNVTIEYDKKRWSTDIEGEIGEILVDGRRINDVHMLAEKVVRMTKTIKILAFTATALALMAVIAIAWLSQWLISHESSIERLLLTSSTDYNKMSDQAAAWKSHQRQRAYVHLKEFHGLHWDEGMQDWVNHAMVDYNRATGRQRKPGAH